MAGNNKIEWCTHTENPFTGCTHSCKYCYARGMALRWAGSERTAYHRVAREFGDPFVPTVHRHLLFKLNRTLQRARRPRDVFLGSMSDMCCGGEWVVMDHHQVLENTMSTQGLQKNIQLLAWNVRSKGHTFYLLTKAPVNIVKDGWPDNVRLGVSVTHSDDTGFYRLNHLRKRCSRLFTWASVEPLLDGDFDPSILAGLDWVVIGAQTGAGAPRLHAGHPLVDAARRIVDYCGRVNIPCFVKSNMRQTNPGYEWPRQIPAGCVLATEKEI